MEGIGIEFEGLRELGRALKETEPDLYRQIRTDLLEVGEVVRRSAVFFFTRGVARNESMQRTADGFHARVRFSQGGGLLTLEQKLRKTTGKRPDYGSKQVRNMLRGRAYTEEEQVRIMEGGVVKTLHKHGLI